jgi:hypothetical protein
MRILIGDRRIVPFWAEADLRQALAAVGLIVVGVALLDFINLSEIGGIRVS